MTVYVDELRRYAPGGGNTFRMGSSHLTADTLEELHAFAERIGMRRAWFQDHRVPHYDLTTSRHAAALRAGAILVPSREQARKRIEARAARATCRTCGAVWPDPHRSGCTKKGHPEDDQA